MEKMALEIISGMKEWRVENPKATFVEIERETMRRMAELQARLIEEIVETSGARSWEDGCEPNCPECGSKMKGEGKHNRSLQASGGGEVEIEREYAKCPECELGIFPPG